MGSVQVDIPLSDQWFYDNIISDWQEELKMIGVMFEYGEVCQYIGKLLAINQRQCFFHTEFD